MMKCNIHLIVLCIVCASIVLMMPARADLVAPAITHVYFERDGMPYNNPVDFSVNCYGYTLSYPYGTKPAGSYEPELVFHYSASCKGYGCAVYPVYYLQYTHIDWCNLEGSTSDGPFMIRNFSSSPYTRCDSVPRRTWRMPTENENEDFRHSYYATPEYDACTLQNYSSSNPGRNKSAEKRIFSSCSEPADKKCFSIFQGYDAVTETKSQDYRFTNSTRDLMNESRFMEYLESCDPLSDPECGGWILDGRPLKEYTDLFPFRNNVTHIKEHPCDWFLVATNGSLIIPESDRSKRPCVDSCSVADDVCDAYFTIPKVNTSAPSALAETVGGPLTPKPWIGESYSPAATTRQTVPVSPLSVTVKSTETVIPPVHRSPVESLYCAVLGFFGAAC